MFSCSVAIGCVPNPDRGPRCFSIPVFPPHLTENNRKLRHTLLLSSPLSVQQLLGALEVLELQNRGKKKRYLRLRFLQSVLIAYWTIFVFAVKFCSEPRRTHPPSREPDRSHQRRPDSRYRGTVGLCTHEHWGALIHKRLTFHFLDSYITISSGATCHNGD